MLSVLLLLLALVGSAAWYVKTHKEKVRTELLAQLNENLDGKLTIGEMEPEFFTSFPRLSLRLENVHLRDSRFESHKKEFLSAGKVEFAVNAWALLRGKVDVAKINIENASVCVFKDASGYSNTSVFKKKKKENPSEEKSGLAASLRKFSFQNVTFIADNRQRNKFFHYKINSLKGKVDYDGSDWNATADLDGFAHSMSFNRDHGSFMKENKLQGHFEVSYDADAKKMTIAPNDLTIGDVDFTVSADFEFPENGAPFKISIKADEILWSQASGLLSSNIREKLDLFKLDKPIVVSCDLDGDFDSFDDPVIIVKSKIRDNTLETPGGTINHCNFDGLFHNTYVKGKGSVDANSMILLKNLTGEYGAVPFSMPQFSIYNLEVPVARGKVSSRFEIPQLNSLVDKELLDFQGGSGKFDLDFTADVNDFTLVRPQIKGRLSITDASLNYARRNFPCRDLDIDLNFTDAALLIEKLSLQTGKSRMELHGKIDNFLKFYYENPELIQADLHLKSQQLNLSELIGFAGSKSAKAKKSKKKSGNFTNELSEFLDKSKLKMDVDAKAVHYKKFVATGVRASAFVGEETIALENARFATSGGTVKLSGKIARNNISIFDFKSEVMGVNVSEFFRQFDNFGMESFNASNLRGRFYFVADFRGKLRGLSDLVPKSLHGNAKFTLKNGALLKFDPIRNVGKFAFPNRDLNNIVFSDLNGGFTLKGEKVELVPMRISSSVINLDLEGIYSFGKGTEMYIDVPLRDPKRDRDITDKKELAERRHRGVVVHLLAADDPETGKVKMKLTRKRDKE